MEEAPKGITMKTDSNYVDVLDEDKAIAGQKFACLSFISPEQIVKQRELYLFEKFVKNWDFNKSMEKYHQFLNVLSFKYSLDFDGMVNDFKEYCEEEKDKLINNSCLD